jgi:hypothetical protein
MKLMGAIEGIQNSISVPVFMSAQKDGALNFVWKHVQSNTGDEG